MLDMCSAVNIEFVMIAFNPSDVLKWCICDVITESIY